MEFTLVFVLGLLLQLPFISAHRAEQAIIGGEFIDIATGSEFNGLGTFANLPYVNCLNTNASHEGRYDIAILGAPFDTVSPLCCTTAIFKIDSLSKSVTGRPGARFGPAGIRRGSQRMSPSDAWNIYTGENTFLSWAKIVDCGDVRMTYLDNTVALKQLDKAHQVRSRTLPNVNC
jgi:agmatinase